jgi:hypothetical protein
MVPVIERFTVAPVCVVAVMVVGFEIVEFEFLVGAGVGIGVGSVELGVGVNGIGELLGVG